MRRVVTGLTLGVLFFILVIMPLTGLSDNPQMSKAPSNSPYTGTGPSIDVFEFAQNNSLTFQDATNITSFLFDSNWYPTGYQGYRLHAEVMNLYKTVNPLPNGDFEQYDEPGHNWTLTQVTSSPYIIKFIDNETGGNPGYCLKAHLANRKLLGEKTSYIYNNFTYFSQASPDTVSLSFDIKFSSNITTENWLEVEVTIFSQAENSLWERTTDAFHPSTWTHINFPTIEVNESVTLRIMVKKTISTNLDVNGIIYFDNFKLNIGSASPPSEVELNINGTAIVDTGTKSGEINLFADFANKTEAPLSNCWETSQLFEFNSTESISFDYQYTMFIKSNNADAATTSFTALADSDPTWEINYTIPSGRPPSGYTGYQFGINLESGWIFHSVKNDTGHEISEFQYNSSSRFVLIDENIASVSDTFSIISFSSNYIIDVYPQKGPSSLGPWTNISDLDYITNGEYLRIMATLNSIEPGNNFANISVFFPNNTLWMSDDSPVFDAGLDRVISTVRPLPLLANTSAGNGWIATVSFNSSNNCGMRSNEFSSIIETQGDIITPTIGSRYLWGDDILINVTWQNTYTLELITDATCNLWYFDSTQIYRSTPIPSFEEGFYALDFSTNQISPNRTTTFDIEFYKYGYANSSLADNTNISRTINVVNDLNYEMLNPTTSIGQDEYRTQTAHQSGFTIQVRFEDPVESEYIRNDTTPWENKIRINYTRHDDTGSGWNLAGTGYFISNSVDPTIFEKLDGSYAIDLIQVRYVVTMFLEESVWDYEWQNFTIFIEMVSPSTLTLIRAESIFATSNTSLGGTSWVVPISDTLHLRFNFTDEGGQPIEGALASINWDFGTESLLFEDGQYYALIDLNETAIGTYSLTVNFTKQNYEHQTLNYELEISRIQTQIQGVADPFYLNTDEVKDLTFQFFDISHDMPISGADLVLSIPSLNIINQSLIDNGDGTYTVQNFAIAVIGEHQVFIRALASNFYSTAEIDFLLIVRVNPVLENNINTAAVIIAIIIIIVIGSWLLYRRVYYPRFIQPKQEAHQRVLLDTLSIFDDVTNLSRILVLHRGSGIAIFDPFSERGMDASLIGGFLQAISAFAIDVSAEDEKDIPKLAPLHEISYEGFRVIIHDGRFVRTAVVYKGEPSITLRKKLEEFTRHFESRYFEDLKEECFEPEPFREATDLLEKIFHISLLRPHKVEPKISGGVQLTDLEARLHGIALALTKDRDSVYLQELVSTYLSSLFDDELEVLNAIFALREKGYLTPLEFMPLYRNNGNHSNLPTKLGHGLR